MEIVPIGHGEQTLEESAAKVPPGQGKQTALNMLKDPAGQYRGCGMKVGNAVGTDVGQDEGIPVGISVGICDGIADGTPVGVPDGVPVGVPVGCPVGDPVGITDGLPVGCPDGIPVGSRAVTECDNIPKSAMSTSGVKVLMFVV